MPRHIFRSVLRILPVIPSLLLMETAAPAEAAQEIVLISDQSQIVTLDEPPATVVVGNPAIADATTDGHSLYLHPRAYGLTNVLVFNSDGKTLGDYLVRVVYEDSQSVSMYSPAGRATFTCTRDCEPALRMGDSTGFMSNYSDQARLKNDLAAGQAMGEDLLLPAPVNTVTTSGQ